MVLREHTAIQVCLSCGKHELRNKMVIGTTSFQETFGNVLKIIHTTPRTILYRLYNPYQYCTFSYLMSHNDHHHWAIPYVCSYWISDGGKDSINKENY